MNLDQQYQYEEVSMNIDQLNEYGITDMAKVDAAACIVIFEQDKYLVVKNRQAGVDYNAYYERLSRHQARRNRVDFYQDRNILIDTTYNKR